jgi:hypothetical protein
LRRPLFRRSAQRRRDDNHSGASCVGALEVMRMTQMLRARGARLQVLLAACLSMSAVAAQTPVEPTVYRCPGPPVLYTDALSPQEARDRGCRTIESAPVTVVQGPARAAASAPAPAAVAAGGSGARIDAATQRARDNDARRILGDELRREEARLATLRQEYNNGQPERRGDERNFQRYLDRVASLKADIDRTESDIAALKRELAKLPP